MAEIEIKAKGYRCDKCGHEWVARKGKYTKHPALCPKCKTPYWNNSSKR